MSQELYGFFNSAEDDARSYEADDLATAFRALSVNGVANLDHCLHVAVEGGTMRTLVSPGRALVQGYFYELRDDGGAQTAFTHAPASGADRVDRIVVRLDLAARTAGVVKKEGAASASPVPPALTRTGSAWELSLAQVRVRAGATAIPAADVTDERPDENLCGAALPETLKLSSVWSRMQKSDATPAVPGLMSAADKKKLDELTAETLAMGGTDARSASAAIAAVQKAAGTAQTTAESRLEKASVYNALDKEEAGCALDARQGRALKERMTLTPLAEGLNWRSGTLAVPGWSDWAVVAIGIGNMSAVCMVNGQGTAMPNASLLENSYQYTVSAIIASEGDVLSFPEGYAPRMMVTPVGGAPYFFQDAVVVRSIHGVLKR